MTIKKSKEHMIVNDSKAAGAAHLDLGSDDEEKEPG